LTRTTSRTGFRRVGWALKHKEEQIGADEDVQEIGFAAKTSLQIQETRSDLNNEAPLQNLPR